MLRKTIIFLVLIVSVSCDTYTPQSVLSDAAMAHSEKRFDKKQGIEVDFVLHPETGDSIIGTMTWLSKDELGLVHLNSGVNHIYNENGTSSMVESDPDTLADYFHSEKWPELLVFPFMLRSSDWKRSEFLHKNLNGKNYRVKKVSIPGESKRMNYEERLVYVDPETNLIHAIVIGNLRISPLKSKSASIVIFDDYRKIDRISIAHRWEFRSWTPSGKLTDSFGYLHISDIKFLKETENYQNQWTQRYSLK